MAVYFIQAAALSPRDAVGFYIVAGAFFALFIFALAVWLLFRARKN